MDAELALRLESSENGGERSANVFMEFDWMSCYINVSLTYKFRKVELLSRIRSTSKNTFHSYRLSRLLVKDVICR